MRSGGQIFMALTALILAMPIVVVCAAALNSGRSMFFPPESQHWRGFTNFSYPSLSGPTPWPIRLLWRLVRRRLP